MAWQLVREVLDHAPAALGPSERMVLVAIAESSRRCDGRTWTGPQAELVRRTGLGERALRKALVRLGEHGLDPRVVIGQDRHGRPVYAHPGTSPTFVVPLLPAPDGCPCDECRQGGTTGPPSVDSPVDSPVHNSAEGGTTVPPHGAEGGTTVPPRRNHSSALPVSGERYARPRARRRGRARTREPGPGQSPLVAVASRSCSMCDADSRLLEVGRFVPVSPPQTCDHSTDHAAQVARARADESA